MCGNYNLVGLPLEDTKKKLITKVFEGNDTTKNKKEKRLNKKRKCLKDDLRMLIELQ